MLDKAVEMMPDVELKDGLPKEQLMQFAAVLVEQRAAKRAIETEKNAVKAAAKAAKEEEAAEEKAAQKAAKELMVEKAAARAAEKLEAMEIAEPAAEGEEGFGGVKATRANSKNSGRGSGRGSGKKRLTKEQKEIEKRMAGTANLIAAEIAAVESEMSAASEKAALARIRGDGGHAIGPIVRFQPDIPCMILWFFVREF